MLYRILSTDNKTGHVGHTHRIWMEPGKFISLPAGQCLELIYMTEDEDTEPAACVWQSPQHGVILHLPVCRWTPVCRAVRWISVRPRARRMDQPRGPILLEFWVLAEKRSGGIGDPRHAS